MTSLTKQRKKLSPQNSKNKPRPEYKPSPQFIKNLLFLKKFIYKTSYQKSLFGMCFQPPPALDDKFFRASISASNLVYFSSCFLVCSFYVSQRYTAIEHCPFCFKCLCALLLLHVSSLHPAPFTVFLSLSIF